MAELADALDLGSSTPWCAGSTPVIRTIRKALRGFPFFRLSGTGTVFMPFNIKVLFPLHFFVHNAKRFVLLSAKYTKKCEKHVDMHFYAIYTRVIQTI